MDSHSSAGTDVCGGVASEEEGASSGSGGTNSVVVPSTADPGTVHSTDMTREELLSLQTPLEGRSKLFAGEEVVVFLVGKEEFVEGLTLSSLTFDLSIKDQAPESEFGFADSEAENLARFASFGHMEASGSVHNPPPFLERRVLADGTAIIQAKIRIPDVLGHGVAKYLVVSCLQPSPSVQFFNTGPSAEYISSVLRGCGPEPQGSMCRRFWKPVEIYEPFLFTCEVSTCGPSTVLSCSLDNISAETLVLREVRLDPLLHQMRDDGRLDSLGELQNFIHVSPLVDIVFPLELLPNETLSFFLFMEMCLSAEQLALLAYPSAMLSSNVNIHWHCPVLGHCNVVSSFPFEWEEHRVSGFLVNVDVPQTTTQQELFWVDFSITNLQRGGVDADLQLHIEDAHLMPSPGHPLTSISPIEAVTPKHIVGPLPDNTSTRLRVSFLASKVGICSFPRMQLVDLSTHTCHPIRQDVRIMVLPPRKEAGVDA